MENERRQEINESLRNFVEWCQRERFYGKTEITWKDGKAVHFTKNQSFNADDFRVNVGSAT